MEAAILVPVIILFATGAFLVGVARRDVGAHIVAWVAVVGAALAYVRLWDTRLSAWGWIESDPLSGFLGFLVCVGVALTLPISRAAWDETDSRTSSHDGFLLVVAAGIELAVSSRNLLIVAVSIEVVSYALHALGGRDGMKRYSAVAASVSMFLAVALFRVDTGSLDMARVESVLVSRNSQIGLVAVVALGLFVIGLFVKLAANLPRLEVVGVPAALTAQIALFGVLLRMRGWFLVLADSFQAVLLLVALAAMFVGNVRALRRSDPQDILSSSFLVHVGFLALGVAAGGTEGRAAVIFYLGVAVVMGVGVWSAALSLGSTHEGGCRGRGWSYPFGGIAMSLLLFSMAGFPLTMGFVARLYVLRATSGTMHSSLVAVVLLNLLLCFYYYMKVVLELYAEAPTTDDVPAMAGIEQTAALVVCAFVVLAIGLWPEPCISFVKQVAMEFF